MGAITAIDRYRVGCNGCYHGYRRSDGLIKQLAAKADLLFIPIISEEHGRKRCTGTTSTTTRS